MPASQLMGHKNVYECLKKKDIAETSKRFLSPQQQKTNLKNQTCNELEVFLVVLIHVVSSYTLSAALVLST